MRNRRNIYRFGGNNSAQLMHCVHPPKTKRKKKTFIDYWKRHVPMGTPGRETHKSTSAVVLRLYTCACQYALNTCRRNANYLLLEYYCPCHGRGRGEINRWPFMDTRNFIGRRRRDGNRSRSPAPCVVVAYGIINIIHIYYYIVSTTPTRVVGTRVE